MLARWGVAGAPLLPAALREAWSDEELPSWLEAELSDAGVSRLGDLSATALASGKVLSERGKALLAWMVKSRLPEIQDLPAVSGIQSQFSVDFIPWTTRTRNAIRSAVWQKRLPASPSEWGGLRIRDFMTIPNLGPASYLDFACTLEAAASSASSETRIAEAEAAAQPVVEPVEIEPWMRLVSHSDPRFRDNLPVGIQTLAQMAESLMVDVGADAAEESNRLRDVVFRARLTADRIASQPLEVALAEYVGSLTGLKGDRLSGVLDRLQMSGQPRSFTLEEVAMRLGITRERARQLQLKFDSRISRHPVFLPQLDAALELLEAASPIDADSAARLLRDRGITESPFHPQSVLRTAARLGRPVSLVLQEVAGQTILTVEAGARLAIAVEREASRLSYQGGVFRAESIVSALRTSGVTADADEVRTILDELSEYEALADAWYWHRGQPGSFVEVTTAGMLSLVAEMDVGTIREGLGRGLRWRTTSGRMSAVWIPVPPPREALESYFQAHPSFVRDGSSVRMAPGARVGVRVTPTEATIASIIRESPTGLLDRSRIVDLAARRGVSPSSTALAMTYSPYLENLGGGIWTLRGIRPDPVAVAELRRQLSGRTPVKRVTDYGWRSDGRLYFSCVLPKYTEGLVLSAPATIVRYIGARNFDFPQDDSELRVDASGIVGGYKRWLRQVGADEGDVATFVFDLVSGRAVVELVPQGYSEEE